MITIRECVGYTGKTPTGITQQAVAKITDTFTTSVLENQSCKAAASHATGFKVPIYNIWKQQEKTPGSSHFGNSEITWLDNLLYLYTRPFETVDLSLPDRLEAMIWIRRNQVSRRNLTDDQRAMNAAGLAELESEKAKRERAKKAAETRWKPEPECLSTAPSDKLSQRPPRPPR